MQIEGADANNNLRAFFENMGEIIYACLTLNIQNDLCECEIIKNKKNFIDNIPYIPGLTNLIYYFLGKQYDISYLLNSDKYRT